MKIIPKHFYVTSNELANYYGKLHHVSHSNDAMITYAKQQVAHGYLTPLNNATQETSGLMSKYKYTEVISPNLEQKLNQFHTIDVTYYAKPHGNKLAFQPDAYHHKLKKALPYLKQLDNFLTNHSDLLANPVSINERSYQIFGYEKVFASHRQQDKNSGFNGQAMLNNLHLDLKSDLNCYQTYPFITNIPVNNTGTTIFTENEDPTFDFVKLAQQGQTILGQKIANVIYGSGENINGILSNPLITTKDEFIDPLYCGDIDQRGIKMMYDVYTKSNQTIKPWMTYYKLMIEKAHQRHRNHQKLHKSPSGNWAKLNSKMWRFFFKQLSNREVHFVTKLMKKHFYIPQEIITLQDLKEGE